MSASRLHRSIGILATGSLLFLAAAPAAIALPAAAALPAGAPAPSAVRAVDDPATLTVMSRNLYLGADVGIALDLLPDMPGAAQFMWDQVAATDFDSRVGLLADEAVAAEPDVISLQEATTWACRPAPWRSPETVYDFTAQFIEATRAAGVGYVVAEKDGAQALNPGYEIPAIPWLSRVTDPDTFQPRFGTDSADCGFTIADALLVREDLAGDVLAAGTSEYEERYAVVPVVFTIDRGYAWIDLAVAGTTTRVVTTHLESLWSEGAETPSAIQTRQLLEDLASTTVPLVVIGDFNADPRDPRPADAPNPGEQPEASDVCPAQPDPLTMDNGDPTCNAFWTMIEAGFAEAGPDPLDPANNTWGSSGDLAGPDPERLDDALAQGNPAGFTDRLDHVFLGNGAQALNAQIIGNQWPGGDVWQCDDPSQITTTEQSSAILAAAGEIGAPITGRGVCLPTDHAGVVAEIDVSAGPAGAVAQDAPPAHDSFRLNLLQWIMVIVGVLVLLVVLLVWGIYRLATRGRRRRRKEAAATAGSATS
jgi:endonuclease/exonuclease/phosphatase family metal-dependent hydrolase